MRARKVTVKDFEEFDLILAMDKQNIDYLLQVAPQHLQNKIHLFLNFANNFEDQEVPDPYYGGAKGFKYVLDLVKDASDGLLRELAK